MDGGEGATASRRRFLAETMRAACGVGLGAGVLAMYARSASSLPPAAIRPPGAIDEQDFLAACVRCGLCVRECPYGTLRLAALGEDVPTGTPYFIARLVPCEMCEDIPCVAACPTGALDGALTDIDDARMGLAAIVDETTCLNFLGLRCDVCYRVCPLIDEAITLEPSREERPGVPLRFLPTVHADACTGCGKCERACVLEEAAIAVQPREERPGRLDESREGNGRPGVADGVDRVSAATKGAGS